MGTKKSLAEHLRPNGPKRILALDGGGIRGALSIGYLIKLEKTLREQHDDSELVLSDYFDLIGGTSTGAIIATLLAMGKSVDQVKKLYLNLGPKIFANKNKWWSIFRGDGIFSAGYSEDAIEAEFKNQLGDIKLGDQEKIKTGLCIVAKRADTNSVWPFINHPGAQYYNKQYSNKPPVQNKEILLRDLLRASSAAPTYFMPHVIDVGGGLPNAAFVDGGVSMANNPSLQLLMIATLNGFPFKWPLGEEKLLIVSVGTGMTIPIKTAKQVMNNNLLGWAKELPNMFMQDANWYNQTILQWLGATSTPWQIDREIGDLTQDSLNNASLFSYLRYNVILNAFTLKILLDKDYSEDQVDDLAEMSNGSNVEALLEIGVAAASKRVNDTSDRVCCTAIEDQHFSETFKLN